MASFQAYLASNISICVLDRVLYNRKLELTCKKKGRGHVAPSLLWLRQSVMLEESLTLFFTHGAKSNCRKHVSKIGITETTTSALVLFQHPDKVLFVSLKTDHGLVDLDPVFHILPLPKLCRKFCECMAGLGDTLTLCQLVVDEDVESHFHTSSLMSPSVSGCAWMNSWHVSR